MGSSRPHLRRALIPVLVSLAVVASAVSPAASASADPSAPTPVSPEALPTAQVNGVVWAQTVIGDTVYVGGSFTETQPAGAAAGVDVVARSNMLAYDVGTGVLKPGFAPAFNAQVRGLTASPDGRRLYAAGDFTSVNGIARRGVVAIDPSSGQVDTSFTPSLNSYALSVAVHGATVFVGGAFTSADGSTRPRAAAFNTSGRLLGWAPQVADYTVKSLAVSPDGAKVLLAGNFTSTNGQTAPGKGMAAVDSSTGASLPWETGKLIHDGGAKSSIYSLSTRGGVVYATGQATGISYTEANLEGMVAMNWSDGTLKWIEDCHGDTYSSVSFNDAVYVAGHPHYCKNIGGFDEISPNAHRAIGFSQSATQIVQHNTKQGPGSYADFAGLPAPTLLDWYPSFNTGSYTGAFQGPWSVTAGAGYLLYGGEFTKVNGTRQTGLVRFRGSVDPADAPVATPTPTPTPTSVPAPAPTASLAKVKRPTVLALGPSRVAARWTKSRSAGVTSYIVKATRSGKVAVSARVTAPKLAVVLRGLKAHTTYHVSVTASSASATSAASSAAAVTTKRSGSNASSIVTPHRISKVSATSVTSRTVKVSWRTPSTKGGTAVSGYRVRVLRGGELIKATTLSASKHSLLVKGLKSGSRYSIEVTASNWAGSSAERSVAIRTRR